MPDLAWQLTALTSLAVCTGLGVLARRVVARLDERRQDR